MKYLFNQTEEEFKKDILDRFKKSFHIREEITGKHITGKSIRIDAAIKPINTTHWANDEIIFGIEFKRIKDDCSIKDITNHAAQAIDYAHTQFYFNNKWQYVPVLICPSLEEQVKHHREGLSWITHLVGDFRIGDIYNDSWNGLTIRFKEHKIWSEKHGVMEGKRNQFKHKIGSR